MKKIIFVCIGMLGLSSANCSRSSFNYNIPVNPTELNDAIRSSDIDGALEVIRFDNRIQMDMPDNNGEFAFDCALNALLNCNNPNTCAKIKEVLTAIINRMDFPLSNDHSAFNNHVVKSALKFGDEDISKLVLLKLANKLNIDEHNPVECVYRAANRNLVTYKTAKLFAEKMTESLVEAVQKSDVERVRQLLDAGANPSMCVPKSSELPGSPGFDDSDSDSKTNAITCAFNLEYEKLDKILSVKSRIARLRKFRETNQLRSAPLVKLSTIDKVLDHLESVKLDFLEAKNEIEAKNKEIRRLLIQRQNAIDSQWENLLDNIENGLPANIDQVLSTGLFDLGLTDKLGRNLLHLAIEAKKFSLADHIINVLVETKAFSTINAMDANDRTPLHYAAMYCNAASNNLAAKLLRYSNANAEDCSGAVPLYYAVANNNLLLTKRLLDGEAKDFITEGANHVHEIINLMRTAIANNSPAILEMLLKNGAQLFINHPDLYGSTVLTYGISSGNDKIMELLIRCGADASVI